MPPEIESSADQSIPQSKLQGRDFGDWNTWQQVYDVVADLRSSNARNHVINLLGLPEEMPWEKIEAYLVTQDRIYYARRHGLPEDSPAETIDAHRQGNRNEWVRAKATELGLSPDASKSDVYEAERQKRAKEAGLADDAPWQNIYIAEQRMTRERTLQTLGLDPHKEWAWEAILRRALCLQSDASTEDFVQRIEEIRTWQIERFVQQMEADKPLK